MGKVAPHVGHTLEPLIPLGLFLMIYPTVTKVPFRALRRSALEVKLIFGLYFLYVSLKFITAYFGIHIW